MLILLGSAPYLGIRSIFFVIRDNSFLLRYYWWLFTVMAVILVILLDKIFWRKDDKIKMPEEGRLKKLRSEQRQENHNDIGEEYKL